MNAEEKIDELKSSYYQTSSAASLVKEKQSLADEYTSLASVATSISNAKRANKSLERSLEAEMEQGKGVYVLNHYDEWVKTANSQNTTSEAPSEPQFNPQPAQSSESVNGTSSDDAIDNVFNQYK